MIDETEIFSIDPNATYQAEEVAWLLFRVSSHSFKRLGRRRQLEGFPQPISRWGKKMWSGAALLAWRDRQVPGGEHVIDITAKLAERARAIGGRRRPG